ncbi:unnamed protein product [Mucor hiemalis]
MLDETGQMVIDEDAITEVLKRIPHKSVTDEAEEATDLEVIKLRKKRFIQIESDEEESEEEQSDNEDFEEEWEYTTATPGDAEDQKEAEEDKEEEELDYE